MAIEKLMDGKIRVQDLEVGSVENSPVSNARIVYDSLLRTELYDNKRNQWNWFIDSEQKAGKPDRLSSDQLLGVYVAGLFDREAAEEQYESLKKTDLFDPYRSQWNHSMDQSQQQFSPTADLRLAESQLMGILVEDLFNKSEAKIQYKKLEKTKLYDREKCQWNYSMNKEGNVVSTARNSTNQLLGVLVKGLFDNEEAREQYDTFKETQLYDNQQEMWYEGMDEEQQRYNTDSGFTSVDLLLGVLVEGMFDKENARTRYKNMKDTELYDKVKKQWNWQINQDQYIYEDRFAFPQLLGVWAEHEFGEKPQFHHTDDPLPEMRRF